MKKQIGMQMVSVRETFQHTKSPEGKWNNAKDMQMLNQKLVFVPPQ